MQIDVFLEIGIYPFDGNSRSIDDGKLTCTSNQGVWADGLGDGGKLKRQFCVAHRLGGFFYRVLAALFTRVQRPVNGYKVEVDARQSFGDGVNRLGKLRPDAVTLKFRDVDAGHKNPFFAVVLIRVLQSVPSRLSAPVTASLAAMASLTDGSCQALSVVLGSFVETLVH